MSSFKKKSFITASLPYVNATPHLGNLIGSTLSADVYARHCRKCDNDVMFLCGTDEYGTTTEVKALEEGLTCEEICAKYRQIHKTAYEWFNISFDIFGKTTTETQTEMVHNLIKSLIRNKHLTEKMSNQFYCTHCSRYISDRYIYGKCYYGDCDGLTKGDECNTCCNFINTNDLTVFYCSICKNVPEKRETTHLYLNLETFRNRLIDAFIDKKIMTNVQYLSDIAHSITQSWLSKPLEDRCITRDLNWGTPFPKIDGYEKFWDKVFYVWFDAPIGYLSILKHGTKDEWLDWLIDDWVQFMAKDNVPFHTILFPATLMAAHLNFFPTHISSTHYLIFDDKKFSKSDGVGIKCDQVMKISDRLGIDEDYWRYYLLKIRPETADSSFTIEHFCEVIKGELAQKIGNLVNRTLMLIKQIYGQIPVIKYDFTLYPEKLIKLNDMVVQYIESFDKFSFRNAITIINTVASIGNKWYDETLLSTTCKSDPEKYEYLAGNATYIIWLLSELCEPVMPKKSAQMKKHFCVNGVPKFALYDDIFKILKYFPHGTVNIDHSDVKIMFKQILPKQFIE